MKETLIFEIEEGDLDRIFPGEKSLSGDLQALNLW